MAPRPAGASADTSASEVEEVARLVEQFSRRSGFERRCRIGEAIFTGLFAGSRLTWRAQGPAKNTSFRELARRLEGCISKSELHRSVKTHLLTSDLPFIVSSPHLTVSHADAVEGLRRSDQERLLRQAEGERWNVRRLREEKRGVVAQEGLEEGKRKRGRPKAAVPEIAHTMGRSVKRKLEEMGATLRRALAGSSSSFEDSHHARLAACLEEIQSECDSILRWLAEVGGRSIADAPTSGAELIDRRASRRLPRASERGLPPVLSRGGR